MNKTDFIVLDLETTGLDPNTREIYEVCARVYHCRTLEPYPASQGGEFYSLMRPMKDEWDPEAEGIAKSNGHTPESLKEAPHPAVLWPMFIDWARNFNKGKSKGEYDAPLLAGKNILFDLSFIERANSLYYKKKVDIPLFNKRDIIELEQLLFPWFENDPTFTSKSMDALRERFGLSKQGAHSSRVDVLQTGTLICHFLRLHRKLRSMKTEDGAPIIDFALREDRP